MKNLKPRTLISIIVLFFILCYIIYIAFAYSNNFKNSVSEEKVMNYLQEKYGGNFKNINLLGHEESSYQR